MNRKLKLQSLSLFFFILIILLGHEIKSQDLVGHWTFEPGTELQDLTGNFSDLVLQDGATVVNGQLNVDPGQWANAIGYTGPVITNKTLISWVYMEDLDVRAGSILTIDKTDEDVFDGIVYAERQPYQWIAGSNSFSRTQDPVPGFVENKINDVVALAITYEDMAGTPLIKIYRDGTLIGEYSQGPTASWSGANTEIVFGIRHTLGGTRGQIDARIEEARIYDGVLTEQEIISISNNPSGVPTLSQWGLIILGLGVLIFGVVAIRRRVFTLVK